MPQKGTPQFLRPLLPATANPVLKASCKCLERYSTRNKGYIDKILKTDEPIW